VLSADPVSDSQRAGRANARTVDVLGNWAAGPGPLHRKLAAAIKAGIERGELRVGSRLPAERAFAEQASVSRSTVYAAWEELKRDGWLESRRGSGTWVRMPPARNVLEDPINSMASLHGIFRRGPEVTPVDFTTAQLEGSEMIVEAVADLAAQRLDGLTERQHLAPHGLEGLREAVANRFCLDGVPTDVGQILITTGFQQALTLVASLFVRAGETVVAENPTSLGALDALRSVGARMRGVAVTDAGLAVEELVALMNEAHPRLVYLIPTYHNPTGVTLPGLHRRRVARIAGELEIPIVEDLSHASIGFGETPPPPIAHYDEAASVISIGSMSKLFWSGLRVGWVRASEQLIARLGRMKAVADLGTPLLSQAVAIRLLARFDEVVAERARQVPARLASLEQRLQGELPDWRWRTPDGGLAVWIKLPAGSASAFTQLALRHKVVVLPGPLLSVTEGHDDRLRVACHLAPSVAEEGVRRLALAWRDYVQRLP
jgi:DNA-binding transcriptional MocR family regulator